MPGRHGGDRLHGIEHARGRLALDDHHVGDRGIRFERGVEGGRGHRRVLRRLRATHARRRYSQMRTMRLPYAPLTRIATFPDGGTRVPSIASTMKVPLPCRGTQTWRAVATGQLDQPLAHARVELDELGIARAPVAEHRLLTVRDVVSGPG